MRPKTTVKNYRQNPCHGSAKARILTTIFKSSFRPHSNFCQFSNMLLKDNTKRLLVD